MDETHSRRGTGDVVPPEQRELHRRFPWIQKLMVGVVVSVGVMLTTVMFEVTRASTIRGIKRSFGQYAFEKTTLIEVAFNRHLADLNALKRFFIASSEVTETEFEEFADPVAGVSGVQAFAWIPRVKASARLEYEAVRRASGLKDFVITESAGRPQLVRAGDREEYFPVGFAIPSRANSAVIGVDAAAEPALREAMDRARDTGQACATARKVLGWLPDKIEGIVVFQPIYLADQSVATVEERRAALRGFAASAIHPASLIQQTLLDQATPEIAIELIDDTSGAPGNLLYSNVDAFSAFSGVSADPRFRREQSIEFAGRHWHVVVRTCAAFHENRRSLAHYWILPVGLMLTVLAARQTRSLKLLRRRSDRLAAESEAARRVADERIALCVRGADLGTWDWDLTVNRVSFNAHWSEMLGYQSEELSPTSESWKSLVHPEDEAEVHRVLREHLDGKTRTYETEHRLRHKSGTWVWVLDRGTVVERGADGKPSRMCGTYLDVTARKQAEEALSRAVAASARLRAALVAVHRCQTLEELFQVLLDEAMKLTGLKAGGLYLINGDEVVMTHHRGLDARFAKAAERRSLEVEYVRGVLETTGRVIDLGLSFPAFQQFGATFGLRHAYSVALKAGDVALGLLNVASSEPEPPNPVELEGLAILVSEIDPLLRRLRAQRELSQSEHRLDLALSAAKMGVWEWHPQSRLLHWSRECASVSGFEELPSTLEGFKERVHREDLPVFEQAIERALAEAATFDFEFRVQNSNETSRWLTTVGRAVHDADGKPSRVVGTLQDMTARKRMEEHLRHAQKLEGIGQMAGGLAHEFNNILAAILLNQSFIQQHPADAESQESIRETIDLTRRAATLVRQLIAFSSRSVLDVKRLDLDQVLQGLCKLIEVQVGERIRLDYRADRTPVTIEADRGMIEQVVVNLCMNARDAMPEGGTLEIRLEERVLTSGEAMERPAARPGHFAVLTIKDTGHGIDPTTLNRLFEPFFTTKPVGAGSGMGLATAYGILQQHRGWVEVISEVHQGSLFRVFLPAAPALDPATLGSVAVRPARLETPTILLVEDEAAVRRATGLLLRRWGYVVEEASDGDEARARFNAEPEKFHLLLSDMVMPGKLSGLDLALALTAMRPELKVILISGVAIDLSGAPESGSREFAILNKPCPPAELRAQIEAFIGIGVPASAITRFMRETKVSPGTFEE